MNDLTGQRTVCVTGVSTVSAKPDYIELNICLSAKDRDYGAAAELAAAQVKELQKAVTCCGLRGEDLVTVHFTVNAVNKNERDGDGYRSVLDCYEYRHNLKLGFGFNLATLGKVLSALNGCKSHPEVRVGFTVKDTDAIKAQLIKIAVEDAVLKATRLAEASGCKLSKIVNITYGVGATVCENTTRMCYAAPEINPSDAEFTDSVNITWALE